MTVRELKDELAKYKDDAIIMFVDDAEERHSTAIVGSNENEEGYLANDGGGDDGDVYCTITII